MESALALMIVLVPDGEERGAMAAFALMVVLGFKIFAGASGNRWWDEHLRGAVFPLPWRLLHES